MDSNPIDIHESHSAWEVVLKRACHLAIRVFALGIVFVLITGAQPAYAFSQDWGGAEDDWSMPTTTGSSGPTVTACIARASNNQKCRECAQAYYDNGEPKSYKVCAWWAQSASCACQNANTARCVGVGSCTYYHV